MSSGSPTPAEPDGVALAALRRALLDPDEAALLRPGGGDREAAVLAGVWMRDGALHVLLTRRREDLRRHAGEISFPGGRPEPEDGDLVRTALREAHEEVGLAPDRVEVLGALPPVGTRVTGYRVLPIVGVLDPPPSWTPQPTEVAEVLELSVPDLLDGAARRRLVRQGVPFRTPTYLVGGHLVWGATARMVGDLLERLPPALRGRHVAAA